MQCRSSEVTRLNHTTAHVFGHDRQIRPYSNRPACAMYQAIPELAYFKLLISDNDAIPLFEAAASIGQDADPTLDLQGTLAKFDELARALSDACRGAALVTTDVPARDVTDPPATVVGAAVDDELTVAAGSDTGRSTVVASVVVEGAAQAAEEVKEEAAAEIEAEAVAEEEVKEEAVAEEVAALPTQILTTRSSLLHLGQAPA